MIVIFAIRPNRRQPRLVCGLQLLEHKLGRLSVIDRCNCNYDDQQQAECIDGDISLSSRYFLASIVSTAVRVLTRFHSLTVNRSSTWINIFTRRRSSVAHSPNQYIIDAVPSSITAVLSKVFVHCALGWKVVWQHIPLAAAAALKKDCIHYFSHEHRSQTTWKCFMQQWLY